MSARRLLLVLALLAGAARAETLRSDRLTVDVDPAFPAIREYRCGQGRMALPAGRPVVLVNGRECAPRVAFIQTGADAARYDLDFPAERITCSVRLRVADSALYLQVTDIVERGPEALATLAFPELAVLAAAGADQAALARLPGAYYKTGKPEDEDEIGPVQGLPPEVRGASYAFACSGGLAAGAWSNALDERQRLRVRVAGAALTVAPGPWTWRAVRAETTWEPELRVVVAEDRNGDGQVTWQDAAVAARAIIPAPYGAASIPSHPLAHILMNFASQATTPFLRGLDQLKKVWLYTDGLGQRVQFKGFAGEGHDSSHPDYGGNVGRRQGGRDDLNLVMRRGHDFGVLSGVHINAQEYHKEAKHFRPELVDSEAPGWSWLDESFLTNYIRDAASGSLGQRLLEMRADLPYLDFAYLDVYFGQGWPAWRMHALTNGLGIMQHTEFPGVMERAVIWNHVANDWTQAVWGAGDASVIARFLFNHQRDTFGHTPLLRGANCDGFLGWHGEHDLNLTIRSAFTVNLPSKYLQHYPLLRQDGGSAWFEGGVRSEVKDGVARIYGPEGQLVDSCRYPEDKSRPVDNLCFIPWDPLRADRIYHWNDLGGDSAWELPAAWRGVVQARLYRLTDLGRVFERTVAVQAGRVTLTGILAATPYVLYREDPGPLPDMQWGEGGLVRDPGFDSHGFGHWRKAAGGAAVRIENDVFAQTALVLDGPGEVRQTCAGLTPGRTYAASVWVGIEQRRRATLAVLPAPPGPAEPALDRGRWTLISQGRGQNGNAPEKLFDRDPATFWQSRKGRFPFTLDVALGGLHELEGFSQSARTGLPAGTIKGFEAFTSIDGRAWTRAAAGSFAYAGAQATVRFPRKVRAAYFRLVATSALDGGQLATCAELDFQGRRLPGPDRPGLAAASRSVDRTVLPNFTDQSQKFQRRYHRLKVLFTAPADGRADLVLSAGEGTGAVRFDDVRLVASGVSKPPAAARNVVLFEDFEHVDEGWGPFLYAFEGPMQTHLSQAHPPYTDDTLGGEFSLKSWNEDVAGLVYRTVPATLALKPDTRYRVSFRYRCDVPGRFSFSAGSDDAGPAAARRWALPVGGWKTARFTASFTTGAQDDWFLGMAKDQGKGVLVIDDLLVQEIPAR